MPAMKLRIVTGLGAAVLLLALIYFGNTSMLTTAVLFFAVIAYLEFDRLLFPVRSMFRQLRMVVLILLTILAISHSLVIGFNLIFLSFIVICISYIIGNESKNLEASVRDLCRQWLGYIYILSLFGFILPIILVENNGTDYFVLLLLIVFVGDTAAYFVGCRFGKHKLAPNLSPKKSIEGSLAAVVAAILITIFWAKVVYQGPTNPAMLTKLILFAPFGSALAQIGDLFESLLKRSEAKKDSGAFLPGHGGILDRIDGLALISPIYYVYLTQIILAK